MVDKNKLSKKEILALLIDENIANRFYGDPILFTNYTDLEIESAASKSSFLHKNIKFTILETFILTIIVVSGIVALTESPIKRYKLIYKNEKDFWSQSHININSNSNKTLSEVHSVSDLVDFISQGIFTTIYSGALRASRLRCYASNEYQRGEQSHILPNNRILLNDVTIIKYPETAQTGLHIFGRDNIRSYVSSAVRKSFVLRYNGNLNSQQSQMDLAPEMSAKYRLFLHSDYQSIQEVLNVVKDSAVNLWSSYTSTSLVSNRNPDGYYIHNFSKSDKNLAYNELFFFVTYGWFENAKKIEISIPVLDLNEGSIYQTTFVFSIKKGKVVSVESEVIGIPGELLLYGSNNNIYLEEIGTANITSENVGILKSRTSLVHDTIKNKSLYISMFYTFAVLCATFTIFSTIRLTGRIRPIRPYWIVLDSTILISAFISYICLVWFLFSQRNHLLESVFGVGHSDLILSRQNQLEYEKNCYIDIDITKLSRLIEIHNVSLAVTVIFAIIRLSLLVHLSYSLARQVLIIKNALIVLAKETIFYLFCLALIGGLICLNVLPTAYEITFSIIIALCGGVPISSNFSLFHVCLISTCILIIKLSLIGNLIVCAIREAACVARLPPVEVPTLKKNPIVVTIAVMFNNKMRNVRLFFDDLMNNNSSKSDILARKLKKVNTIPESELPDFLLSRVKAFRKEKKYAMERIDIVEEEFKISKKLMYANVPTEVVGDILKKHYVRSNETVF